MALKGFRKPQQTDGPTQALTNAVGDFTRQLEQNPLLDGKILSGVTVGTTSTNIPHTLGRAFRGWFLVRSTSSSVVYEVATQTDASQYLTLMTASSAVFDIYVF